jgi:hypothetical protein
MPSRLIVLQNQRVITCGEDGQVRLWAQEAQPTSASADAMDIDKKKKRRDKKKKDRYNPY